MNRQLVLAIVLALCGVSLVRCKGDASSPAAPTNPTTPQQPRSSTVQGTVVDHTTNQGIRATIQPQTSASPVVTDASGRFEMQVGSVPLPVAISSGGYVTRTTAIAATNSARDGLIIDLWSTAPPFSLEYFRQLAHNTRDNPSSVVGLWIQTSDLRFYIRTVDIATGTPLTSAQVDNIIRILNYGVREASAGKYGAADIQTGVEDRGAEAGVRVYVDSSLERCGQATVGDSRGFIKLKSPACDQPLGGNWPPQFLSPSPQLILHELGHVMGLWHASPPTCGPNVMGNACWTADTDDLLEPHFSSIERFHIELMYSRPRGNTDPDNDPLGFGFVQPPGGLVPATVVSCFNPSTVAKATAGR